MSDDRLETFATRSLDGYGWSVLQQEGRLFVAAGKYAHPMDFDPADARALASALQDLADLVEAEG